MMKVLGYIASTAYNELVFEGVKQRRKVMGDAYVDNALTKNSSEFAQAAQNLATEAGWGYIWTRPGLPHRDRSLVVISMLSVMGK